MKSYVLGSELVLATTFIDPANNNQLVDPTTVLLELLDPLGTVHTLGVSNPSTGIYKAVYTPTLAGVWTCRWVGTGAVNAATETRFEVRPSAFTS